MTGSPEVWACLRFATEALQKGDVATAQGLLNAQECTCPDGQLWSAVYDDRGILYKIPEWLIIEPAGLVEEDETVASGTDDKTAVADAADDEALGPDLEYVVRARISSTSQDFQIPVRRRETIASIREKLKTQAKVRLLACYIQADIPEYADETSWTWIQSFASYMADVCTQTMRSSIRTDFGGMRTTTFLHATLFQKTILRRSVAYANGSKSYDARVVMNPFGQPSNLVDVRVDNCTSAPTPSFHLPVFKNVGFQIPFSFVVITPGLGRRVLIPLMRGAAALL